MFEITRQKSLYSINLNIVTTYYYRQQPNQN